MATGMFENDASGNCLQQPPGVPDSPDSIPLPDSPPPESNERVGAEVVGVREAEEQPDMILPMVAAPALPDLRNNNNNNNNNNEAGVVNNMPRFSTSAPTSAPPAPVGAAKRKGGRKPRPAEEYDPSEPLTSSDEEEHSIHLVEGGEVPSRRGNTQKSETSSGISYGNSVLGTLRLASPPPSSRAPIKLATTSCSISAPVSKCVSVSSNSSSVFNKQNEQIIPGLANISSINSVNSGGSSMITANSSSNSGPRLDLSTIPVPPDENRRPVIHFSIPTRHRLLPISSLIKRQKRAGGVAGGPGDGRGLERMQDGEEDEEEEEGDESNRPKISLVAEIFGGSDDDEEEENQEETEVAPQQQPSVQPESKTLTNDTDPATTPNNGLFETDNLQQPAINASSGRWKLVAEEPKEITNGGGESVLKPAPPLAIDAVVALVQPPAFIPPAEPPPPDPVAAEDEPEIIEIVTLNVPPTSRLRPLRRRPIFGRLAVENGGEPEVIDIDKDEDEAPPARQSAPVPVPPPAAEERHSQRPSKSPPAAPAPARPPRRPSVSPPRHQGRSSGSPSSRHPRSKPSASPPRRATSGVLDISASETTTDKSEKRHGRASPVANSPSRPERHFKRPHSSSSMSNCEEGEIVDSVSKKRKKDKKKKTKRRKRSKDSMSPPPSSSKLPEKRLSDSIPQAASTSDQEEGSSSRGNGAISWRKPSKRTQNRNYRDGKPKADDTFFREKELEEKQQSGGSPSLRRSKPSSRKERSPVKEKSSKHRRDGSPRAHRSHSKSPARRASRSRSRSSGRPHRSRRRNRHSRSRSSNSSDKSRSARSSSRRRSRKRYRRSTSRHHAGDSRSPSYITEPIRSRTSHYSKFRDRSRSRSRDKHRGRHRSKRSLTRSRTPSPRGHKKNRRPESVDRQHRKKQVKERERQSQQQVEAAASDSKDRRKERERAKEKEKRRRRERERPKEEEKSRTPKEKPKDKEKKKKKKRREKSPTPVKAIVADGDSIVVSLSFQKGKTASSSSSSLPSSVSVAAEERKEMNGLDTSETSEPSPIKPKPASPTKTVSSNDAAESINNNNSSSFNEEPERAQSSPAKLSNVTDEEESTTAMDAANATEGTTTTTSSKPEDKETEAAKVTSSGVALCSSNSPFEAERALNAAPDSTKTPTPQPNEQQDSSLNPSVRSSVSPTTDAESNKEGDTLVTSTGDSIEAAAAAQGTEDETKSNTSSTPSKQQQQSDGSKTPATTTTTTSSTATKVSASSASPRVTPQTSSSASVECSSVAAASTSSSSTTTTVTSGSANSASANSASSQSSVTQSMTRPLIGNIPGLYPSNAIIAGGGTGPVPPPIVIPTPPPPRQIMYSNAGGPGAAAPMLNPNVLASVASALLAVRQTQAPPTYAAPKVNATAPPSDVAQLRNFNVLGAKAQNFSVQSNYRTVVSNNSFSQSQELSGGSGGGGGGGGGGDSPMSPNSSDGDDLFEPPSTGSGGPMFIGLPLMSGGSGGGGGTASANDSFNASNSGVNKGNERSIFDTLFGAPSGSPPKKPAANKPEKVPKGAKVKHRKGNSKKEIIKVNTSGGLTEGELRLTDEVPTSAVELIVKQKYLKKLNRQERVVEEVKVALKPYYSKRQVNKDEYKEILRRAVPKICHNKTGEINPGKIKELVDAYVKKFRYARKRGLDLSSVK